MTDEVIYVDKNGNRHKKPPKGISPFKPKPIVDEEGCSLENGILCRPILNGRVRKYAESKKV